MVPMKQVVQKTIELDLTKVNGNAYAIIGAFRLQAKRENWSIQEIDAVTAEATKSDYDNLLAVIQNHIN